MKFTSSILLDTFWLSKFATLWKQWENNLKNDLYLSLKLWVHQYLVMKYTRPFVESRGLHAIFQKRAKKGQKRAKYLNIWARMYNIWKYFENRQSHVCNYHMHETAGISWICFWNALVFFLTQKYTWSRLSKFIYLLSNSKVYLKYSF